MYFPRWRRELLGSLLQWSVVPFQCLTVIKEKNAMHNEIPQFWSLFLLLLFSSHWGCGVGWGVGGEGLSKMQKNISSILTVTAFNWVDNQLYLYHINAFVKDAKKINSYYYSLKLSWQPVLLTYINAFVKDAHKKHISYSYSLRLSWQLVLLTYINAFVKDAKKHISYSYGLRLSWQPVLLTYII